jgi:hypothetical protein
MIILNDQKHINTLKTLKTLNLITKDTTENMLAVNTRLTDGAYIESINPFCFVSHLVR